MIQLKRAYEKPARTDECRVLVDHLWPRGIKKESLKLATWAKSVAPSNALRTWFGHDPAKWDEFRRRFFVELDQKPESWEPLLELAREGDLTLVFGARDREHNNAVALKQYLEKRLPKSRVGKKSRRAKAASAGRRTRPATHTSFATAYT